MSDYHIALVDFANLASDGLPSLSKQLWHVLKDEMDFVGSRPGLFSQEELIDAPYRYGVFAVRPGMKGATDVVELQGALGRVDNSIL